MNLRFQALGMTAAASLLQAAPVVDSGAEFSLPLENQPDSVAVVDKATGQVRLLTPSGELGPFFSGVRNVSSVAGGFINGSQEFLSITSAGDNQVKLLAPGPSFSYRTVSKAAPGPAAALPLQLGGHEIRAWTVSNFGNGGAVHQLSSPFEGQSEVKLVRAQQAELADAQTLRLSKRRLGLGIEVLNHSENKAHLVSWELDQKDEVVTTVLADAEQDQRISSEVVGADGRQCVLLSKFGDSEIVVVTLASVGFDREVQHAAFDSFPLGVISPVPPDASGLAHGFWVTSADGRQAAKVVIEDGKRLKVVDELNLPKDSDPLQALHSLGSGRLLTLHRGRDGRATSARRWTGGTGNWKAGNQKRLATFRNGTGPFPTLFYFSGAPLLAADSTLVKVETKPDWTQKVGSDPLPNQISFSTLNGVEDGLQVVGRDNLQPPAGATHVLTNQVASDLSLGSMAQEGGVTRPGLEVTPLSGTFTMPFRPTFDYDREGAVVFFRHQEDGNTWRQVAQEPVISYGGTYQFYAENTKTKEQSAIVSRNYQFSASPPTFDSDGDGVPDYVEAHLGLDPTGGADSDGDLVSDLEELLAKTDPANASDRPTDREATTALGEGFRVVANARVGAAEARPGTGSPTRNGANLLIHSLSGGLLGESQVETFTLAREAELGLPRAFLGTLGAPFFVNESVPADELVIFSTPTFFPLTVDEQRGSEIVRVTEVLKNERVSFPNVLDGDDLAKDAEAWIRGARSGNSRPVRFGDPVVLTPIDNLVAAVTEKVIYDILARAQATGLPANRKNFTLFPFRETENQRQGITAELKDQLYLEGYSTGALASQIDKLARANTSLVSFANSVYQRHQVNVSTAPLLLLPLDLFRGFLQTGEYLDPVSSGEGGRTNPYANLLPQEVQRGVNAALDALQERALQERRVLQEWVLTVEKAQGLRPHQFRVGSVRAGDQGVRGQLAWPVDRAGERYALDQGLGLQPGTTLVVRGFLPEESPTGFRAIELISLGEVTVPAPTASDQDGDLLEDAWEEAFFGSTEQVRGWDRHPETGHDYLQYMLEGENPRSGILASPVISTQPMQLALTPSSDSLVFEVVFEFPTALFDQFEFNLRTSDNLESFQRDSTAQTLEVLAPGRYRIRTSGPVGNSGKRFWQLVQRLKE